MAKIEKTGYHTTKRLNADKILASGFKANLKTNEDWLGEGIYFWDDEANAQWWKTAHFKGVPDSDICTLHAKLICEEEEYVDLSKAEDMKRLTDFVNDFTAEMMSSGKLCPDFKTENQIKHFYCTLFKKRNQIKLMRHTFEHKEINVAGFQLIRPQLCATDNSVINDVTDLG